MPKPALARVMPLISELHTVLALGHTGRWILGVGALMWTIDCLWSVALTLSVRGLWRQWGISWRIKRPARALRMNFDLHRRSVSGLVCAIGIAISLITVTGIVIWWKKHSARRWSARRNAAGQLSA
jgi:uncharacterized iron-regulated membrane protein